MAQQRSRSRKRVPGRRTQRRTGDQTPTDARQRDTSRRALRALRHMRAGASLSAATRLEHIKPSTFMRYAGSTVQQDRPGGRYRARPTDRLSRELEVPSTQGLVRVSAKGIKQAREFSRFSNAVGHFNRTGDDSKLRPFREKTFVDVNGQRVEFVTDPSTLLVLAAADLLGPDLYTDFTGGP